MALSVQKQTTRLWAYPFDSSAGKMTGPGTAITPEDGRVQNPSISPDGRFVAFVLVRAGRSQSELMVTDFDTKKTEVFAATTFANAWAPDSRTLAYSLIRPDRVNSQESALAVRTIGDAARLVRGWTKDSSMHPTGWTSNGRSIIGAYWSPTSRRAKLVTWPLLPSPAQTERPLIDDPQSSLYQGSSSPDGRWLTFISFSDVDRTRVRIFVAREGAAPAAWIRIAANHAWADKPRWSPDGRRLYFISDHGSPYFNLWGVRFDPDRGTAIGEPFQVTRFDTPGSTILPDMAYAEIGISARRAILPMQTVRGNIWVMENVDR
jgi:Tol biopolymer transport system component